MTARTGEDSLAQEAADAFRGYLAGDHGRMADLVSLLTKPLWAVARAAGLSPSQAEDVVQGAWLRLVQHADAIRDPQAVFAWLLTTVRRDAWRVAGRPANDELPDEPASADAGPESTWEEADDARILLAPRHRAESPLPSPSARGGLRVQARLRGHLRRARHADRLDRTHPRPVPRHPPSRPQPRPPLEPLMTTNDEALPLTPEDEALLAALAAAQDAHDPLPPGMIERISLALSLELMEAELAVLTADQLEPVRADSPVDSITFTSSSLSLMVTLTPVDDEVRLDGWVTGGGVTVELLGGDEASAAVSDATGRLTWSPIAHGPIRFRITPPGAGARVVVTPTIEV
ncbi:MAG: sigma factor [Arachnia sp.]